MMRLFQLLSFVLATTLVFTLETNSSLLDEIHQLKLLNDELYKNLSSRTYSQVVTSQTFTIKVRYSCDFKETNTTSTVMNYLGENWNPPKVEIQTITDVFNDRIDYSALVSAVNSLRNQHEATQRNQNNNYNNYKQNYYQEVQDIFYAATALNSHMITAADKYKLFGNTEDSLGELNKFLNNYKALNRFLRATLETLPEDKLSPAKPLMMDYVKQMNELLAKMRELNDTTVTFDNYW
mmetsp:Transcript_29201/g.41099  ORF Transcript_29201/g.41099 Transcript_29201/m.41099 type:complete len:237 (-) Transcript_29201:71-781(-)